MTPDIFNAQDYVRQITLLPEAEYNAFVDQFEAGLSSMGGTPAGEGHPFHAEHEFGDHIYQRTLVMPAGSLLSSKIHKTRHPFVVHAGVICVISLGRAETIVAPYRGWTEPGTRRMLFAVVDTVWSTYHANPDNERDIEKIESRIIEKRENPLLTCPGSE